MLLWLKSCEDWRNAIGYLVAFAWALFWLWFGVASGISESATPMGVLVHAVAPGFICLALAVAAVFTVRIGPVLLVAAGIIIGIAYLAFFPQAKPNVKIFCELTLAAPPLVAGLLLLKHK